MIPLGQVQTRSVWTTLLIILILLPMNPLNHLLTFRIQMNKGLTLKDQSFINSQCRTIAKCESHGLNSRELRQQIYMLGLYTFRQFHKAGTPKDITHPGLLAS